MPSDLPASFVADEPHEEHGRPFLHWRGLHVDMAVLRLFCAFWVTFVIAVGCVWIILAPTNQQSTNAAFAILGSIVTGWISWMVQQ